MKTTEILARVQALAAEWQAALGADVKVVLGGSLVSDTFVNDGAKVVDVDIRFLVDDPEAPGLITRVEAATGLRYRKTIAVADWPVGQSTGHMIEGILEVPGIDLPCEVEGCLRSRKYVGWHQYYQLVFSADELAAFRADKLQLRSDKAAYKARKFAMIEACKARALSNGLVPADRAPFER